MEEDSKEVIAGLTRKRDTLNWKITFNINNLANYCMLLSGPVVAIIVFAYAFVGTEAQPVAAIVDFGRPVAGYAAVGRCNALRTGGIAGFLDA